MKLTRIAAAAALAAFLPALPAQASTPGPFVTFLFSRSEELPAQNCQADAQGGVSLVGTVAPDLAALGIAGTGTVNTLATSSTEGCTHIVKGSGETLTSSWSDLQQLGAHGWTFGPHEYDSAARLATLTPKQDWAVTCGQAQTLAANGLAPSGMIAYPGAQGLSQNITALQAGYGANCFDWGRAYDPSGLTTQQDAVTAPYWQKTMVLKGGPGPGSSAYTSPASAIAAMQALQPGQWLTIQVYLLVTGTSPAGDVVTWNCDPATGQIATSDVERYCYGDFLQVAQAASQMQSAGQLTVTSPLAVGTQFGRSAPGMPQPKH
jgi:hypothetical protein